jgi:SAM-dependent methyltransferase
VAEERANWDGIWASTVVDVARLRAEEQTLRWKQIEAYVGRRWGGFQGLRVIEIGSGHGTNAMHFARRGATVAVLDNSDIALEGAQQVAAAFGVTIEPVMGDVLELDPALVGAFDISCSFGLCEHFLDVHRQQVVAAHLELLKSGGAALISVPNRRSFPYRAWMGFLKWRDRWPLGTEEPFSVQELAARVRGAGGEVVHVGFGSFAGTLIGYSVNPFFHKAGRPGLRQPQIKTPMDAFAYELLVIGERS